jgi:hypothetical protein
MGSQCCGLNKRGERCQRYAKNGIFCLMHDPERSEERERWKEALKEGMRATWTEALRRKYAASFKSALK